ncbi:MAG: hypothetical protein ACOH2E_03900 [Candidatus Paracaedibacter sp.]
MPTAHIKKLEAIREQKKTLQEEENKVISEAIKELSKSLIDANALDVENDMLMGGVLEVIEKIKLGDKITEAWKISGEKFRKDQKKRNGKKSTGPSKKIKKNKSDDE